SRSRAARCRCRPDGNCGPDGAGASRRPLARRRQPRLRSPRGPPRRLRQVLKGPISPKAIGRHDPARCKAHEIDRPFPDRWHDAGRPPLGRAPRSTRDGEGHESTTDRGPHPDPPPQAVEGERPGVRSFAYERLTPRMRRMRPGCFSFPERTISSWSGGTPGLLAGSPGCSRPEAFGPPGPGAPTGFAAPAATAPRRALPPRAAGVVASSLSPSGPAKLKRGSSRTGGPAGIGRLTSNGAFTTRSREALSSPPSADQTSEIDRPRGGGSGTVR